MATLMTWFVPAPGAERDLLVTTIGALAAACAAPAFPPHVTIVPMYDSDAGRRGPDAQVADRPASGRSR